MNTAVIIALLSISIGFTHAQNVGIGILQPTNKLHVIGSASSANNAAIYAINNGVAGNGVFGISNAPNTNGVQGFSTDGTGIYGYSNDFRGVAGSTISGTALYGNSTSSYGLEVYGKVKIAGGNTNPENGAVLTSDAVGNAVWKPRRVAFKAFGVNNAYLEVPDQSARRVQFRNEAFDLGDDYRLLPLNESATSNSSIFTSPVSGIYHFDVFATLRADILIQDIEEAYIQLFRNRNGVETQLAICYAKRGFRYANSTQQPDEASFSISTDEALLAGDKIYVVVYQNSGTTCEFRPDNQHRFSGHLVFAD